ncbi:MAG: hypothetical protein R3266_03475 [Gemmatimonadota bacterium]|nr:hypothetical protein [Gemmatimonadota bacterium]
MSEFIEIGFWLFVFLALALRNVANRAKQTSEASTPTPTPESEPDIEVTPAASPSTPRASRPPRSRAPERDVRLGRRDRPRSESGRRRSILGDWSELAHQLEEQIEARTSERRPVEPPRQRPRPRPPEPSAPGEDTVLVPGRRIRPNEIGGGRGRANLVRDATRAPDRLPPRPATRPRLAARTDAHRPARVRRPGSGGLDRFERYDPLQRAILLSEILGPPPGLGDEGPGLGRWDPPV